MATADVTAFVQKVVDAMDLDLEVSAEEMPDGLRVNLDGEDGNVLIKRQGEALAALQHNVSAVYRHETAEGRRLVVDCMGYRKGKADELQQMAIFLAGTRTAARRINRLNPTNAASSISQAVDKCMSESIGMLKRQHHFGQVGRFSTMEVLRLPSLEMFSTSDTIVAIATPCMRGLGRGSVVPMLSGSPVSQGRAKPCYATPPKFVAAIASHRRFQASFLHGRRRGGVVAHGALSCSPRF